MNVVRDVEQILFDYIKILPIYDVKDIHNGQDIFNALHPDAEQDIKDVLFDLIKQELDYTHIIDNIKDWLKDQSESIIEDSEDEEEDEESNDQETDCDD
jgi:hypothetical protein